MGCGIKDENNDICGETFTCGACRCANERDVHLGALNARNIELSDVKNDRDDLAKRVWGLNDQVDDLKNLLREVRVFLTSEEEMMDYASSSESGQGSLEGVMVRRIEAALDVVR